MYNNKYVLCGIQDRQCIVNLHSLCIWTVRKQGTSLIGVTRQRDCGKLNREMLAYSFPLSTERHAHTQIVHRAIYRTLHAVHQIICAGWLTGWLCMWNVLFLDSSSSSFISFTVSTRDFTQRRTLKQPHCVSLCVMWIWMHLPYMRLRTHLIHRIGFSLCSGIAISKRVLFVFVVSKHPKSR